MVISRVWILYQPRIYTDLFKQIFRSLRYIEVVEVPQQDQQPIVDEARKSIDIVLLSLNEDGSPELDLLPRPLPNAKLVAFAPTGEYGMRRMPGESQWEEVRPFGLSQLMREMAIEKIP